MPLLKRPSKKAFDHNVKVEMEARPDKRAQNLAIAYSVKREAAKKKKMAEGGRIDESAKTEKRPMPEERDKDAKIVSRQHEKPQPKSNMIDRKSATEAQRGPRMTPLKSASMTASSVIKPKRIDALGRRMDEEEEHLENTDAPASYTEQPELADNEEGADRQGPESEDLHMKRMANGGEADPDHDDNMHNESVDHEFGDGAEEDELEHPENLTEEDDEIGDKDAMSSHMKMLAEGGEISPMPEEHEEMAASIASAIMAKLKHAAMLDSGSSDEDEAERFAGGGEVLGKSDSMFDIMKNNKEEPNFFPPRNGAALKENYNEGMKEVSEPEDSNEHADMREEDSENQDDRSIVGSIRRKMKTKSSIIK